MNLEPCPVCGLDKVLYRHCEKGCISFTNPPHVHILLENMRERNYELVSNTDGHYLFVPAPAVEPVIDPIKQLMELGAPIYFAQIQSWFILGWEVQDLLDLVEMFDTKSQARRAIENGALKINGAKAIALDQVLDITQLRMWQGEPILKVTNGKKDTAIVCFRREV